MASIKNYLQDLQGKVKEDRVDKWVGPIFNIQKIELINGLDPYSIKKKDWTSTKVDDIPRHCQLPDI